MGRDSIGNVSFDEFEVLAARSGEGFDTLTYDYHYPIFAGSKIPVKKLPVTKDQLGVSIGTKPVGIIGVVDRGFARNLAQSIEGGK